MPYSYEETVADGSTNQFSIPFEYFNKEHVFCYVDGTPVAQEDVVWVSDTQVQLPFTAGALAGKRVKRQRITPAAESPVEFTAGGLDHNDLNLLAKFNLFVLQEAADGVQGVEGSGFVISVNSRQGYVILSKADVGLGNVDNTSDANKPASTAVLALLGNKADAAHNHNDLYYTEAEVNSLLSGKANSAHTHILSDILGLDVALAGKSDVGHNHDSRYYTETEVDAALAGKANTSHTHDDRYYTEAEVDAALAGKSNTGHTHDDRYFTEAEVTSFLSGKSDTGHTHSNATGSVAGFMSAADKSKLDGLALVAQSGSASDLSTGTVPDGRLPARLRPNLGVDGATTILDWNTATQNGWYAGPDAANAPGGGWFVGIVLAHSDEWVTQTVHAFGADGPTNTETWRRERNGGIWSVWYRIRQSELELDARYLNADNLNAGVVPEAVLPPRFRLSCDLVDDANNYRKNGGTGLLTPPFTNGPTAGYYFLTWRGDSGGWQDAVEAGFGRRWTRLHNGTSWEAWQRVHETESQLDARYARLGADAAFGALAAATPGSTDDSTRVATTEWVRDYSASISAGVVSFNGRSGVVTFQESDLPARLTGNGPPIANANDWTVNGGTCVLVDLAGNGSPTGSGWWHLKYEGDNVNGRQYANVTNNPNTWVRWRDGGVWSSWQRVRHAEFELDERYARTGAENVFTADQRLANGRALQHASTSGYAGGTAGATRFKLSDNHLYEDNYEGDRIFRGSGYIEQMRLTQEGELRINSGLRYGRAVFLGSNVDLNGDFPAGFYDVQDPQNGPWLVPWCYLEVQRHAFAPSSWQKQVLTCFGNSPESANPVVWQRVKRGGTWGPWRPISGYATPEDFGANPAGSMQGATTDDTAAVTRWIDYGLAHPHVPLILNGFYRITAGISRNIGSNNGFGIRGLGPAARQGLVMAGTSAHLAFAGADHDNPAGFNTDQYHFSDFMIGIDSDRSQFAIGLSAEPDSGSGAPGLHMHNVHQRSSGTGAGITGPVFYLQDIRQFDVQNVSTQGKYFAYQGEMFYLTAAGGGAPVEGSFVNCRQDHGGDTFRLVGSSGSVAFDDWQGMHFDRCVGLGVNRLLYMSTGPETSGFSEWVTVSRCHAYYRMAAVLSEKVGNLKVHDSYFLGHGSESVIQGVGKSGTSIVDVVNISNTTFKFDSSGPTRLAVNMPPSQQGSAIGNMMQNATANNWGSLFQSGNQAF